MNETKLLGDSWILEKAYGDTEFKLKLYTSKTKTIFLTLKYRKIQNRLKTNLSLSCSYIRHCHHDSDSCYHTP